MWTTFIAVFLASVVTVQIAQQLAVRRALLDVPNERSSHNVAVPRLGGAAFVPVMMLAVAITWRGAAVPLRVRLALLTGVGVLFCVSLVDDFVSLRAGVRFVVHLIAAAWIVYATVVAGMVLANGVWIAAMLLIVGIVGILNIYNFMDGIDGLAGVQAVVGGMAWCVLAMSAGASGTAGLAATIAAGAAGFLTCNWPPAKIFMGDAGSTVLGYVFGAMPLLFWVETGARERLGRLVVVAALVVWPFLADGIFTIVRRLRKGENILKAHRSHIYQRLVLSGRTHQQVTAAYGMLAILSATAAWFALNAELTNACIVAAIPLTGFLLLLWWVSVCEREVPKAGNG